MYKIKKENLTALFRAIAAEQELYVPVKTAGKVNFGPWSEDAEVDIDTLKSVKSPKDVFFSLHRNYPPVLLKILDPVPSHPVHHRLSCQIR